MNHIIERRNQIMNNIAKSIDVQHSQLIDDNLEKGMKDIYKLEKKIITNKQGKQQTVYVRTHTESGKSHEFAHGDKVHFEHNGEQKVGHIKGLKHHETYDKYGTAEIHDEVGNKYSKSLRAIEHNDSEEAQAKKAGISHEEYKKLHTGTKKELKNVADKQEEKEKIVAKKDDKKDEAKETKIAVNKHKEVGIKKPEHNAVINFIKKHLKLDNSWTVRFMPNGSVRIGKNGTNSFRSLTASEKNDIKGFGSSSYHSKDIMDDKQVEINKMPWNNSGKHGYTLTENELKAGFRGNDGVEVKDHYKSKMPEFIHQLKDESNAKTFKEDLTKTVQTSLSKMNADKHDNVEVSVEKPRRNSDDEEIVNITVRGGMGSMDRKHSVKFAFNAASGKADISFDSQTSNSSRPDSYSYKEPVQFKSTKDIALYAAQIIKNCENKRKDYNKGYADYLKNGGRDWD